MLVPQLQTLSTADLSSIHQDVQRRYDAFRQRGLALDLTRGKPASEQLDLSSALLGLPGEDDFLAADKTDTRNYGVLQGLPELRALLAPLFGTVPSQVVIGDNSSLSLMHDAIVYGAPEGDRRQRTSVGARSRASRSSARCPATTVISPSARTSASR